MSIKIGDVDVANEIVELHFQVARTQLILDKLLAANPDLKFPQGTKMADIEDEVIQILQRKFPSMGIKRK
ncbi:hypothetical protein ACPV5I_00680 [Vibrio gigantis]|uniref:hypothetical protein n=1 Tax=Vibrio crassostreae TaxID=246167 RepID=UPI002E16FD25|nr:hypothetical protein [Vibrio crassostreae]